MDEVDFGGLLEGVLQMSPTSVRFVYGGDGSYTAFTGSFSFDNVYVNGQGETVYEDLSGGTVTGIVEYEEGVMTFSISGLSIPALTFAAWVQNGQALQAKIVGLSGADQIIGSPFDDLLEGWGGDDHIEGAAGADDLYGMDGDDILIGGEGDDVFDGGAGGDTMTGGNGIDRVSYAGVGSAVTVDLKSGATGGGGADILSGIENLIGSDHADTLTGSFASNEISGGAGDDIIYGEENADILRGGDGVDTLEGGFGDDDLYGGAGSDTLQGDEGIDELYGESGDDFLISVNGAGENSAFVDRLYGGGGADFYIMDAGDRVEEFAADDDALVFVTPYPLGNVQIVTTDGKTEIRAWTTDLSTYESIWIESGINPALLAVETYSSGGENGVILTRVALPPTRIEQVVIDLPTVLTGLAATTSAALPTLKETFLGDIQDELIDYITNHENFARSMSDAMRSKVVFQVVEGVAQKLGKYYDLSDRFELGFDIGTYLNDAFIDPYLWGQNGKYQNPDGTQNVAVHVATILEIIASTVPFGDTLIKLGGSIIVEIATEIFEIAQQGIGEFGAQLSAFLEAAKVGEAQNQTTDGDDLQSKGDGVTTYAGGGGDDTQLGIGTGVPADAVAVPRAGEAAAPLPEDDTFDGGAGLDSLLYSFAVASVQVNLATGVATGAEIGTDTVLNIENVSTGRGDDQITGSAEANRLDGGAGADLLTGGGGDDVIAGGAGIDTVVFTGARAGYAISTVDGVTTVTGADGTDTLTTVERLQFADGLFDLNGEPIDNSINGTSGPDTLNGEGTGETINGLEGDDRLSGFGGDDVLNGGEGDDVLDGGPGDDILNGGTGVDTVSYATASAGVTIQLARTSDQNTGGSGRDTLTGIENLTGSAFRDYFTGGAGNNVLSDTLGGNDRFIGGAGNDTLSIERSGSGAATTVTLTGGLGDDALRFDGNGRFTDSVTFEGQDGNDVISALGAFRANVNGGAGNDRVTVDTLGGSFVVKLGSGSDTLILADTDGGFAGSAANLVRDFIAGAGGDIVDLTAYLAGGALTNFTGGSNPFLTGHMRLVQAGADTLVQVDRDGGSNGFVTVLTLQKTFASNFTAYNFNGLAPLPVPVEGGAGADSLTGTSGIDVLNGNGGNDSLVGLAGADVLNGGAGNDVLDGGAGDDVLNGGSGGLGDTATYATASAGVNVNLGVLGLQNTVGSGFDSLTGIEHLIGSAFTDELRGDGFNNQLTDTLGGNDFLRGEAGNDTLLVTRSGGGAATTVRLNGGADNDALTFTGNGRFTDTVTLEGDTGDDVITVSGALTIGIDAGAGNDTVIYNTLGGVHRMTLGTGIDTVRLAGTGGLFQASGDNLVRDFTTGAGGDVVDLTAYLSGGALLNYTGGSNPFGDGHMRLVQNGTRTLLQVDRDGGGNGYQTVLTFANTTAANFTAANFNGIDPTGVTPIPVLAADKDADAGPQVWVQEVFDKDPLPEVLPGSGDDTLDVVGDLAPLPGVVGGGSDPWTSLTLDEAGDGFLTVPGESSPDTAEPPVLPAAQDRDLFAHTVRADHLALITGEDGVFFSGTGPGDHRQDGWLF